MDHVNLDWLLENIDDSVEGAEQMRADLNRVIVTNSGRLGLPIRS